MSDLNTEPLKQYKSKGYVQGVHDGIRANSGDVGEHNASDDHLALDAAVYFTTSNMGPPFATEIDSAGVWWEPAYDAACKAVEDAIVDALTTNHGGRQ